jgi:hypothetical protein
MLSGDRTRHIIVGNAKHNINVTRGSYSMIAFVTPIVFNVAEN